MMKAVFLRSSNSRIDPPEGFYKKLNSLVEFTDIPVDTDAAPEAIMKIIQQNDICITTWGNVPLPKALADNPGKLKYVCNISGQLNEWVPIEIIEAGISVTNWGDAPAFSVAEGAFSLLMSVLKEIPYFIKHAACDAPGRPQPARIGTLYNLPIGIYGLGVIGQKFVDMLTPFHPIIYVFDPYVTMLPEGTVRVNSLDELFSKSFAVAIHAGKTNETMFSVSRERLAMMPNGGIVINTARGGIVDNAALLDEVASGRLRAGIDVLDEYPAAHEIYDYLPLGDPVRHSTNCILTSHSIGRSNWGVKSSLYELMYKYCLENIERFTKAEPLKFVMDADRYRRST